MTTLPLAALVSPLLLYAGAASASIPVLIHLLNKRRFRRVRWAATQFLLEADRRNRRRMRIEELVLLGLRCLAMFLLGIMLARWFVRPEALAAIIGSTARSERIVVIDDSFSMGLRERSGRGGTAVARGGAGPTEPRVFDQARAAVERLLHWLQQESPGDSLTIILTSRPERPLFVEPAIGKMSTSALESELATLNPSSRGGNLPATFAAVRSMLDSRSGAVSASVYLVSDFQQVDWSPGQSAEGGHLPRPESETPASPSEPARSPVHALADWPGPDRHLRVVLMDVGSPSTDNLCVAAIEPQQAQFVSGVSGGFNARVVNFGTGESQPSRLQVYIGDAAQPDAAVPAIGPGNAVDVPLGITFPHEGSETLTVQLEPDALPADDSRSVAAPVARALRILLVNGEPSPDLYQDEVHLLSVALRPEGPQFSGNDVTVVDENEFETVDLADYHAVVLANVYRATEDLADRLESFAEAGGGVMFFLGDQVDGELYNRILYRDGRGLLPGQLRGIADVPADQLGVPFSEPDLSHPALRRFRDSQIPYFQGIVAGRYFSCEPFADQRGRESDREAKASGIADLNPQSAIRNPQFGPVSPAPPLPLSPSSSRGPARVLLRAEDQEASPLLIERAFGNGRVLLMTTTADKEWTNLPDRPVFVVLALELIQYIARPAERAGDQLVGEPIRLRLDPGRYQPGAVLKLPNFPDEPAVRIEAQPEPETGIPTVTWPRTDVPGVYRFELVEHTGAEAVRHVTVNLDPRESDLRRASRTMLLEAMGELPAEYVSGEQLVQEGETQARRELWPALLLAVLLVLMSEQALAWWFGSDRTAALFSRSRRP